MIRKIEFSFLFIINKATNTVMKKLNLCFIVSLLFLTFCSKDPMLRCPEFPADNQGHYNAISPPFRIAVVSDIHYMDPLILPLNIENNTEFQSEVMKDRKIPELSDPVFRRVVSDLIDERPDILLITGDLAREGELVCHQAVKGFLRRLESRGIKVFVIPGNNDINNPEAKTFRTVPASPLPGVTPDEFVRLYREFGYDEALYRDDNSLSYICQPFKGIWILGIDAIHYSDKGVSGVIDPGTMSWITEKLAEANEKNITVLAMMHYGILEHYSGQNNLEPLVKDHKELADALMNSGVRLIFTGHYHATDIVDFTNNGKTLTDIETGSLVTPPMSYRIMKLDDHFANIETRRIMDIDMRMPFRMNFLRYCDVTINARLNGFFTYALRYMFMVPKEEAVLAAPYCTAAFKDYIAGDEQLTASDIADIESISTRVPSFPLLESCLYSWQTDLPPGDNRVHLKLK